MNKKGTYMVSFLVTILLAILIFAPSCMFASKFFRLSAQAKDNFVAFVGDVEDLQLHGKDAESRNTLIILDAETALIYFSGPKLTISVDAAAEGDFYDYKILIDRPPVCEEDKEAKGCFCLFREVKIDSSQFLTDKILTITPVKMLCQPTKYEVLFLASENAQNCGIGIPVDVNSYTCEGGFMADRELIGKTEYVKAYYNSGRRVNLVATKDSSRIKIKKY